MNSAVMTRPPGSLVRLAPPGPARQGGVVLIIALIAMVAMVLAGIAMVRSVDTSTVLAGNLAFKQSATTSGDAGVEAAIYWLGVNGNSLTSTSPSNGYYANSRDCDDLTGNGNLPGSCTPPYTVLNWDDSSQVKKLSKDAADNEAAYVIHRMCTEDGPLDGSKCAVDEGNQSGGSLGGLRQMHTYQLGSWDKVANRGFYRITVRVSGPRATHSFVQAVVSR